MVNYWSALDIAKQIAGELALPQPTSLTGSTTPQATQLLAMLNSAGNELLLYYTWQEFLKEWDFTTVVGQGEYPLPSDWSYFIDQTQWDRTNHWPLLGPKSPQEWSWLKGGLLAAAPRMRYRVMNNNFLLWPVPGVLTDGNGNPMDFNMAMEYISDNWVVPVSDPDSFANMVVADGDLVRYNPWLMVKFIKYKFYELKGMETTGVLSDFMRIFNSLTGKDKGAPKLSLSPRFPPLFIGPWSIPDGSWDTSANTQP